MAMAAGVSIWDQYSGVQAFYPATIPMYNNVENRDPHQMFRMSSKPRRRFGLFHDYGRGYAKVGGYRSLELAQGLMFQVNL